MVQTANCSVFVISPRRGLGRGAGGGQGEQEAASGPSEEESSITLGNTIVTQL